MDEIDELFSVLANKQGGKKKRPKKPLAAGMTVDPNPMPQQLPDSALPCNASHLSDAPAAGVVCSPPGPREDDVSLPGVDHVPAQSLTEHQYPATSLLLSPDTVAVSAPSDSLAGVNAPAMLHGSRLLRDMFVKVPPETVESRLARPLLLDVTRDRSGFAAAKRAGLLAAFLNSATVSTPGLPGSNRPLGRRSSIALAAAPGGPRSQDPEQSGLCSLDSATVLELHELWRAYAFRLTASLAAAARLDPSAAAASTAVHPDPALGGPAAAIATGDSSGNPRKSLGAAAGAPGGARGAFVLEDLSRPGASKRSSGAGRGASAAAVVGIKRLRAVLEGAMAAAAPAEAEAVPAPLPYSTGSCGAPAAPDKLSQARLVGDAEVAAYAPRGFSAQAAGRLLLPAVLQGVDWRFAAMQVLRCPRRPAVEGTSGYVIGVSRACLRLLCPRPPDPLQKEAPPVPAPSSAPPWLLIAVPLHDAEVGVEWPTTLTLQPAAPAAPAAVDTAAAGVLPAAECQPSSLLLLQLRGSLLARAASSEGPSPAVARDLRARRPRGGA